MKRNNTGEKKMKKNAQTDFKSAHHHHHNHHLSWHSGVRQSEAREVPLVERSRESVRLEFTFIRIV